MTKKVRHFRKGERVRYIGESWPDRFNQQATVDHAEKGGLSMVTVIFDGMTNTVRCYASSLELVK